MFVDTFNKHTGGCSNSAIKALDNQETIQLKWLLQSLVSFANAVDGTDSDPIL